MSLLITLLIAILIIAVVLWIVQLLPLEARAKQIIQVAVAIVLLIWLIMVLTGHAPALRIDR